MHTNNEVGTLQPIAEAGALIKAVNPRILFHVDAVQGYGKYRIYPQRMKIDLLSVSGHKIHGPKGTGFLYVNDKVKIRPILFGGGQQGNLLFVEGIQRMDGVVVNGHTDETVAPHIVSVSIKGVRSEVLLHALEDKGIYVSAGSACAARKPQPSATLRAMGISQELLGSTIRFSFSIFTTMEEIDYTLQTMYDIIPMLRKYTRR